VEAGQLVHRPAASATLHDREGVVPLLDRAGGR
jgi:hypothetical protein